MNKTEDLLDEVQTQLAQEKIERMIVNYTPYVIVISLLIIILAAIFITAKERNHQKLLTKSEVYYKMLQSEKPDFDKIINKKDHDIYSTLASFEKAKIVSNQEAITIYKNIMKATNDVFIKDLAEIYMVSLMLKENDKEVESYFIEVLNENAPLYIYKLMLKADFLLKNKNNEEAKKLLEYIYQNQNTPNNLKQKITSILLMVKS